MKFKDYVRTVKSIQSTDPKKVADEFKENFSLMESEDDVMEMTNLIVHICGEQLGEWQRGLDLLKKLKNNAKISDKTHMNRAVGILTLGNNPNLTIDNFSPAEQVQIYSQTACALANLGGVKNAEKFLKKSDEMIIAGLVKEEAVTKILGASGNHIVKIFTDKNESRLLESDLMKIADKIGRKYE